MDDIIKSEDSVSPCLGRMWVIPPTDCLLRQLLLEGRAANPNTATKWSWGGFPLAVIFTWKCTFCQHLLVWGITHSLLEGYVLLFSSFFHTTIWDGSDEMEALLLCLLGDFLLGQDFSKFINICMDSFSENLDWLADRIHPKVPVGNLGFLLPISQLGVLPDLSANSLSCLHLRFCCHVSMFL